MITLSEKRLQELEARIPGFIAQISEYQEKMKEMFSFPHDFDQLRSENALLKAKCDEIASVSQIRQQRVDAKEDEFLKTLDGFRAVLNEQSKTIYDLNKTIDRLKEDLRQLNIRMLEEERRMAIHDGNLPIVSKAVPDLQSRVVQIDHAIGGLQSKCQSYEEFVAASAHVQKVHTTAINRIDDTIDRRFQDTSAAIARTVDAFNQKIASLPVPPDHSDYEEGLEQIRKDIATILTVIHPGMSNVAASEDLTPKVKSLENSIAQIFGLLKKYER